MRTVECRQQTAEWLQIRCGRITASRIKDVMARLPNGSEGAPRRNYRMALIAERLSGRAEDHYTSAEMIWGSEQEQFARTAYEIAEGVMTDQVGFVLHPEFDYAGGSPDSLVGTDGGLEIKCPKTITHLSWMMQGRIPEEHQLQMQWNMACCERAWVDFVSYDPRLPEKIRIFVWRLKRDDAAIGLIEAEVERFNREVDCAIEKIGAPAWVPLLPSSPASQKTVRVVPEDIMRLLDMEIVP